MDNPEKLANYGTQDEDRVIYIDLSLILHLYIIHALITPSM